MTTQQVFERRYCKGEVLFTEGSCGDRIYEIISGEVLIYRLNDEDKQIGIAKVGPGDIIGEMFLLHEFKLRNASAVALSEVVVNVHFDYEFITEITSIFPQYKKLLSALGSKVNKTTQAFIHAHQAAENAVSHPMDSESCPVSEPSSNEATSTS